MKILVACEYSGIVRDAFTAKGHDAMSCDILPTESQGKHYQGDIFDVLYDGWDLMIAHPPCTYLTYAGIGYFNVEKWGDKAREREIKKIEAMRFFMALWKAPINKICIENPRGFPMMEIKPAQMIHPWYFGDEHKKLTCLWLKNLPRLNGSIEIAANRKKYEPEPISIDNTARGKKRYFTDAKTRDPKERAKFWPGIAAAMAEQWG